ncbi:AsmA family protein [Metallibacterium sp.]
MNLRRRTRILLLSFGGVLLLLLLGALLAVHLLLQPQRFTQLLESAASTAGLRLKLAQPASPELFPSPGLVLQGLSLSVPTHTTPMLSASRGKIFVPWRALLGGVPVITRLELDGAQIDLDELDAYIATLPTGKAPWLPHVRTGIKLIDGTLSSGGHTLFSAINVSAGQLEPGRPFVLTLSARNAQAQILQLQLQGTPRSSASVVALDPLKLSGTLPGYGDFALAGLARWLGGSRVQLALLGSAGKPAVQLRLGFANTSGKARMNLAATRPGQQLQASFDPAALLAWWHDVLATGRDLPPLTPPPLAASASVAQLDAAGVHIEGLSVHVDASAAPATSSSAPKKSTVPVKR